MVGLLNYYSSPKTLFQVALESSLLFAAIFVGALLQHPSGTAAAAASLLPALLFAGFMTAMIGALGLYRRDQPKSFAAMAAHVVFAFLIGFPLLYAAFRLLRCDPVVVDSLLAAELVALGGILALRVLFSNRFLGALFARRVLVVGAGDEAAAVDRALAALAPSDVTMVGFYPLDAAQVTVPIQRVLFESRSIVDMVRRHAVTEIIVASKWRRGDGLTLGQLLACKLTGVKVVEQSTFFELITGEVRLDSLRASWLIYGDGFRQGRVRTSIKRTFDLVASALVLTLMLPVMLLTALAIKLDGGGPVLYRQERVGRNGKTFQMIKFRSMRADAEADGNPRWARADDARVTRVGRFIRHTHIDELPQIVNVLKGEMSFVGPRPERPSFVAELAEEIPFYWARHSIKPGITGWAQVNYKYGNSIEDARHKLQFDLFYVKNHSLLLDLMILLKTVKVVAFREGAH